MKYQAYWNEGFKAGFENASEGACPYLPETSEADAWELGWSEGMGERVSQGGNGEFSVRRHFHELLKGIFHFSFLLPLHHILQIQSQSGGTP